MCAHQPASSWRPTLPGTICFPLAASRLGEGPILGQLLRRGPLASSGHPSSAPSKLRLALASMLSQQLWAATQRILFSATSLQKLRPPQTINLLENTFRKSSLAFIGDGQGWKSICYKVLFSFPWRESEEKKSPDLICSSAKYGISCRGIHLYADPCLLLQIPYVCVFTCHGCGHTEHGSGAHAYGTNQAT